VSTEKQNCFVSCVQHFVFFSYRVESIGTVLLCFRMHTFWHLTAQRDLSSWYMASSYHWNLTCQYQSVYNYIWTFGRNLQFQ